MANYTVAGSVIPFETPTDKGFQRVDALKALEFCSYFDDGQADLCDATELEREKAASGQELVGFIKTLEVHTNPVAEFDERLWGCMVDYVTVGVDGGMTVVFRDGAGIDV
ncbi:MAG: hypothetical protein IIZ54_00035 [Selenomonadaceae bacterium]|nr:hypothetical protein [Selenomonadaceae bacterium]